MFFFIVPDFSNLGKKHHRVRRYVDFGICGKSFGFVVDNSWKGVFVQDRKPMSHGYPQEETGFQPLTDMLTTDLSTVNRTTNLQQPSYI